MGRRPILWSLIISLWSPQEVVKFDSSPFYREGGHHTFGLAALAVIIDLPPTQAGRGRSLSIHSSTITHQLAWCQSRLPAAALGELGARLETAILKYVDVCSMLCVVMQNFFGLRRWRAENSIRCQHAAWISVVHGSTRRSFALLEGSVLQGALCTQG